MSDPRSLLHQKTPRYVLEPTTGGYKIERLTWDEDFQNYTHAGYLNRGRKFADRGAARDYMISEVER